MSANLGSYRLKFFEVQLGSIRLHSWIRQSSRPGYKTKSRSIFDSSLYDAPDITLAYGSETMLRKILENPDFNGDQYLTNTAMSGADQIFQWVDLSWLKLFLESKRSTSLDLLSPSTNYKEMV